MQNVTLLRIIDHFDVHIEIFPALEVLSLNNLYPKKKKKKIKILKYKIYKLKTDYVIIQKKKNMNNKKIAIKVIAQIIKKKI